LTIVFFPRFRLTIVFFPRFRLSTATIRKREDLFGFGFIVSNATFSNISAILWRPVLVVEEAGVPGENHRPWASNW
jgi:hypothetical protein